jgi:hypothetical protein
MFPGKLCGVFFVCVCLCFWSIFSDVNAYAYGYFCVLKLCCYSCSLMIDLIEVEKERLLDEVSFFCIWSI